MKVNFRVTDIHKLKETIDMKVKEYLTLLGEATAVPGGGSVSALAGAMGAALGKMVTGISPDKRIKKYLKRFHHNCIMLSSLSEKDSRAYQLVLSAYKLPKQTPNQITRRKQRIQSAFYQAMIVPLNGMQICLDNLICLDAIPRLIKPTLKSDFGVALLLSHAGFKGCLMNVNINLDYIKNKSIKDKTIKQVRLLNHKMNSISKRLIQ